MITNNTKFRVFDKEQNKMLYYDTDIVPNMTLNGVLIDDKGSNVSNRYILMQYTGKNDSNGKEIYESDIAYIKWLNMIHYKTEKAIIRKEDITYRAYLSNEKRLGCIDSDYYDDWQECEYIAVIGNIYER